MRPRYIILIYLVCSILNNLHIYQICDEYFRYDVTSNVRIAVPQELQFPSMTICVDIVNALEWTQMTPELRRYLLTQYIFSDPTIETMVSNASFVEESLSKLSVSDNHIISQLVYSNLATRKMIPEILNLTKPIEQLYYGFEINGLFKEPNGSIESYEMLTTNMTDFQFSIDNTFIHSGLKCFTLSLRPDLHSIINLNDVWNIGTGSSRLLLWRSNSGLRTRVFFHRKSYLVSLKDPYVFVEEGNVLVLTFEVLESILLKYPYNTNCRDYYSTMKLSSQKECMEKCFKSKTIARFGFVFPKSHAFASDDLYTRLDTQDTADITRECKLNCCQKECHSFTYIFETLKEANLVQLIGRNCVNSNGSTCPEGDNDLRKESDLIVKSPQKPFTRTEIQPAISLISFVTAVLSTFGFWMGLSVSRIAEFVAKTWTKAWNYRDKIRSRQGIATQRLVKKQIINNSFHRRVNPITQSSTQLPAALQHFVNFNPRDDLRKHYKRPYFLPLKK